MGIVPLHLPRVADGTIANGGRCMLQLRGLHIVSPHLRWPPGMGTVVAGGAQEPAVPLRMPVELLAGGDIASVALLARRLLEPRRPSRGSHPLHATMAEPGLERRRI